MSEEAAQATEDAAKTRPAAEKDPVVMAIDVGGSHVKILTSAGGDIRRTPSGTAMTAPQMIAAVKELAKDIDFDVVSMGYPGPVLHNRPLLEPANLGPGWSAAILPPASASR